MLLQKTHRLLCVTTGLVRFVVVTALILFNLRRILFALSIMTSRHSACNRELARGGTREAPSFLVLVACRDEESVIGGLCDALACLDYPEDKYRVVLIDDGSRDSTLQIMQHEATGKANWRVLSLRTSIGKAAALNRALREFEFGDIIYVFDADHRPEPDVLKLAAPYFDDPAVAGVSGRTVPSNPLSSPASYYSTVEGYLHQMVTMRAKDRLGLAPALLGSNCGYRRAVLAECGGFRGGALLEDSDLTLAFYKTGHRVRFMEDVIAHHQVPETPDGYLRQHARWARGFNDVAEKHAVALLRNGSLSLRLRAELLLFSLGYLDRLALVATLGLLAQSLVSGRRRLFHAVVLSVALLTPLAQVIALFLEQRVSWEMWTRLPLMPVFLILDIFAAARGMTDALLNRPRTWTSTGRKRVPFETTHETSKSALRMLLPTNSLSERRDANAHLCQDSLPVAEKAR